MEMKIMINLIAFISQFVSYLILFGIMVILAVSGWFIGISVRKRKDRRIETKE
jgi:hypothetical protein